MNGEQMDFRPIASIWSIVTRCFTSRRGRGAWSRRFTACSTRRSRHPDDGQSALLAHVMHKVMQRRDRSPGLHQSSISSPQGVSRPALAVRIGDHRDGAISRAYQGAWRPQGQALQRFVRRPVQCAAAELGAPQRTSSARLRRQDGGSTEWPPTWMRRDLRQLDDTVYDLLVVGGGIHGACIAARRGPARPAGRPGRAGRLRQRDLAQLLQADPRRAALPAAPQRAPRAGVGRRSAVSGSRRHPT